jgi:hypothetical protein
MAIADIDFRPITVNGVSISRDPRSRSRLVALIATRLALRRAGTELDDHLSSDIGCQRKSALSKLQLISLKEQDRPLEAPLSIKETVQFAFGHGMQDMVLGDNSEEHIWNDRYKLWYSPDGVGILDKTDLHENKTTRMWPITKADRLEGLSIEGVIAKKFPQWLEYMLGVMHLQGEASYTLSISYIGQGELECFKIEATEEAIARNWRRLSLRRDGRRDDMQKGNLPGMEDRLEFGTDRTECDYCPFLAREPCATEVPLYNAVY